VFLALILLVALFAAYYYWDRYIFLGDQTPIQLGITRLENAVNESPNDPAARLSLAQAYIEDDQNAKAIEQAQLALSIQPDSQGALLLLGIASTRNEQPQQAIDFLDQFVNLRRDSPNAAVDRTLGAALYYLGRNYLALDQADKAISVLSEAIGIDHTDADAIYPLGRAYSLSGKHDLAIDSFQNAVRFVPDFREAYQGMIDSYTALNQESLANYARGMDAFSSGDYTAARDLLEQTVNELSDFMPVHLGLALTYEQLGEFDLARESANRALVIDPHNFTVNALLERLSNSK
jgi:tetratricopeptide (TPR) repeat protein